VALFLERYQYAWRGQSRASEHDDGSESDSDGAGAAQGASKRQHSASPVDPNRLVWLPHGAAAAVGEGALPGSRRQHDLIAATAKRVAVAPHFEAVLRVRGVGGDMLRVAFLEAGHRLRPYFDWLLGLARSGAEGAGGGGGGGGSHSPGGSCGASTAAVVAAGPGVVDYASSSEDEGDGEGDDGGADEGDEARGDGGGVDEGGNDDLGESDGGSASGEVGTAEAQEDDSAPHANGPGDTPCSPEPPGQAAGVASPVLRVIEAAAGAAHGLPASLRDRVLARTARACGVAPPSAWEGDWATLWERAVAAGHATGPACAPAAGAEEAAVTPEGPSPLPSLGTAGVVGGGEALAPMEWGDGGVAWVGYDAASLEGDDEPAATRRLSVGGAPGLAPTPPLDAVPDGRATVTVVAGDEAFAAAVASSLPTHAAGRPSKAAYLRRLAEAEADAASKDAAAPVDAPTARERSLGAGARARLRAQAEARRAARKRPGSAAGGGSAAKRGCV